MEFHHARCEVCRRYFFKASEFVAYNLRPHGVVTPVDLRGQEPWSGVYVVCDGCIRTLYAELEAHDAAVDRGNAPQD